MGDEERARLKRSARTCLGSECAGGTGESGERGGEKVRAAAAREGRLRRERGRRGSKGSGDARYIERASGGAAGLGLARKKGA